MSRRAALRLGAVGAATLAASTVVGRVFQPTRAAAAVDPHIPAAGLQALFEARSEVGRADGDPLSTITDQSGAGLHLTTSQNARRPTWQAGVLTGQAVYRMDGVDDQLVGPVPTVTPTAFTVSVVVSSTPGEATTRRWVFSAHTGTSRVMGVCEGNTVGEWSTFARTAAGTVQAATAGVDTTVWCVLTMVWDGATVTLYRNGTQVATAPLVGAFAMTALALGGPLQLSAISGDVALAATWTTALNAAERAQLHTYVQDTYGIAVADYSGGVTTLSGTVTLPDGLVIPEGQVVQFDPAVSTTVQTPKNVVVNGTLRMRPNPGVTHTLRFTDIDESKFVGGGSAVLDTDIGLWITGHGVLDAVGTQRDGWNRTGTGVGWQAGDDLRTAPQAVGAFNTWAPYALGSAVPKVTNRGTDYYTEVFNLTRNVIIGGTPGGRAHVAFLGHSHDGGTTFVSAPQTIKWVRFENVGPRVVDPADPTKTILVTGRYGLHFHHCADGTRGSLIEGVVVANCGTRAFVPHASHGITFHDCIAYDVHENGYWWDHDTRTTYPANASDDITYDHCAAFKIGSQTRATTFRQAGWELGTGERNSAFGCVAVGCGWPGGTQPSGFLWPEDTTSPREWTFHDNVAHNNGLHGLFEWQNDTIGSSPRHHLEDVVSYRNGGAGVDHGAYQNTYAFARLDVWGNSLTRGQFALHPNGNNELVDSVFDAAGKQHALEIPGHNVNAGPVVPPTVLRNVDLRGHTLAAIVVEEGTNGAKNDFVSCTVNGTADLEPSDFELNILSANSVYRVQRRDGTAYRLNPDGTGTPIPAFA